MCAAFASSASWPRRGRASAVAIGNFDGVHAGHRAVLSALMAHSEPGERVAFTFDPAPTAVLVPERHQPRILRLPDRVRLLHEAGADDVIVEPFTPAFAAHPAEWFAREVLLGRMGARVVVVGYDFRFGAGRGGDASALRRLLPEAEVVVVEPAVAEGAPVSSSRIRKLVAGGEVEAAARLLGRPHLLAGRVIHGDARGRTLGFPTANLACEVELLPGDGVYAVRASLAAGGREGGGAGGVGSSLADHHAGVMNIGWRPTVAGRERRVEVHLLDWSGDLYGAALTVDVLTRIRGEERFASLDALQAQIARDVSRARELLA